MDMLVPYTLVINIDTLLVFLAVLAATNGIVVIATIIVVDVV